MFVAQWSAFLAPQGRRAVKFLSLRALFSEAISRSIGDCFVAPLLAMTSDIELNSPARMGVMSPLRG